MVDVQFDRRNRDFEEYYKRQEILPDSEWEDFITALKRDLPTTFRITGNKRCDCPEKNGS